VSRSQKHNRLADAVALYVAMGLLSLHAVPSATAAARPDWLQRRPDATAFVIGIGAATVAGPSSSPAYNRALTRALRDVATQLNVHVTAGTSMRVTETGTGLSEEFAGDTQLRAAADLEGTEIVDTWVGSDTCWVYVRLNANDYHESRRLRLANLQAQVEDLLGELRHARLAVALAAGLRAIELAEDLPGNQEVMHSASAGLRERLSAVNMRILAVKRTDPVAGMDVAIVIESNGPTGEECTAASDSTSCRGPGSFGGLPVRWSFARGEGELTPLTWTEKNGHATTRVSRVGAAQGEPLIVASIDLAALGLDALALPDPSVVIVLPRPILTAQLAWDVDRDIDVDIASFASLVASELAVHGIDVSESGDGQLRVDLAVDLRKIQIFGGITFAFIDLFVRFSDSRSTLSRAHAPGLKGAGVNGAEAVRAAFQHASEYLHEAAAEARRRHVTPVAHTPVGTLPADGRQLTTRVNRRTEP
jgi:hypothetical protein